MNYFEKHSINETHFYEWIRTHGGNPVIAALIVDQYDRNGKIFKTPGEMEHSVLYETWKQQQRPIQEVLDMNKKLNFDSMPFWSRVKWIFRGR